MRTIIDFLVINFFLYSVLWLEGWSFERGDNVGWTMVLGVLLTGFAYVGRKC